MKSPWPDLDSVLELTPTSIVATRCVSLGEHFFEHHFPGEPIVPAVMQLSWLEHAGGVLVAYECDGRYSTVLREIVQLTCVKIALPGNCLKIQLKLGCELKADEISQECLLEAEGLITQGDSQILRSRCVLEVVPYSNARPSWTDIVTELGIPLMSKAKRGR